MTRHNIELDRYDYNRVSTAKTTWNKKNNCCWIQATKYSLPSKIHTLLASTILYILLLEQTNLVEASLMN